MASVKKCRVRKSKSTLTRQSSKEVNFPLSVVTMYTAVPANQIVTYTESQAK